MILNTRRTQILMSKQPTDMRLGYDGLAKQAKKLFGQNPYHGQFFVFINRRRTSCKVYTYDGSGDVLICKRLSQGVFCRPNPSYKKNIRITGSEFSQFFEGLNMSGRILESSSHSKPRKKQLRFIPPYNRLPSRDAARGIYTRPSPPTSIPE
jgi:transposase